ncbi:unnamed protein product [Parnassius apollo]|uniref:(apollo) hypothetical protein n=1 Tax=Parnassius apollo TaxID=110799 RepID=A0A8S3XIH0_PARAO|nr:unnamed protein product [Parnassius apollo]
MLVTISLFLAACGLVQSSGVNLLAPAGAPAPVVTASSSQYFERNFNRLVPAQPALQPVYPVAPPPPVVEVARAPTFVPVAPASPVIPVAQVPNVIRVAPVPRVVPFLPARPVFGEPTTKNNQEPATPVNPQQNIPADPNVAFAVATANAAAPVATILLPPYPFGPPPSLGFIPPWPVFNTPEVKRENESTTTSTTRTQATTTERESETTTPVPSNVDNSFAQALPSNDNVNFRQYLPPPFQLPLEPYSPPMGRPQTARPPQAKPQKVKTAVEVVPVPLTYIAPPPLKKHHPVKLIKVTKHIHTFIPTGKIIIRPVSYRTRAKPAYVIVYRKPTFAKKVAAGYPQAVSSRSKSRDVEPTTFRSVIRPNIRSP